MIAMSRMLLRLLPLVLPLPLLLAACGAAPAASGAVDSAAVELTLTRSISCACCAEHEAYLRAAGLTVRTVLVDDVTPLKDRLAVPADLRSCHTVEVAGYTVEGHVPLGAIEQLLAERPDIDGIALPGMPAGAPGMGGSADGPLVVLAFHDGAAVGEFGSYH